ncbi:type VI secretion system Vgr family protein [uncultured Gilliamella sp.]|uniref:type VI secretion system Vgr family protein n=1 Tax=uncultured Gilliamella sp. TaxID=1193505 RepID=UPI0025FE1F96|nr:type VI secretion system Vgr family protein [uncultured Gilliamella sp.]
MASGLNKIINQVGEHLINGLSGAVAQNRYTLTIEELNSPISILKVKSEEQLNQPWRYTITFTCADKTLSNETFLNKNASFSFNPATNNTINSTIQSLIDLTYGNDSNQRKIFGIITEFNQLSFNKDEAQYQVVLSPRLAKLALNHNYAIFQNQSIVSVVEEVLRNHGLRGIDYRLELKEQYPVREFITQWQESDLEFIQRLMADVGIWFRFETHAEHDCDVLIISDYEQGYEKVADIEYQRPSGTQDSMQESIWDISMHSKIVESSVNVQDYNYRKAKNNLHGESNTQLKDMTTYGTDYRYGEHYNDLNTNQLDDGEEISGDNKTESGNWYASIRHQHAISQQIIIHGKTNCYHLVPGQLICINNNPLTNIDEGILITSVTGSGSRSDAYEQSFTAIPYNISKPYRPTPLDWPQVAGTLPARVTSPDNDTYGYIDIQGRYRVKFNFDLKKWRNGKESLWVRLAKPYAGNTYGFHFPLIDGTEVAIAFMNSDPDRPYIANVMHNSTHHDHVTTINKHRNVIRTPTNNKLRMDDKRGQEHIKLATEYGKTQLNLGHLVDQQKQQRGEGFELRTDEWGAIAANRGLYLTTQTEPKAQGKQLDMQGAITELENALSIAKALENVAEQAQSHAADIDSQQQLQSAVTNLSQPGILTYAQEGIALTSPENIQLTTAHSLTTTSANQTDITALKNITLSTPEAISLLAQKSGMKVFANQGDIDVQAQTDQIAIAAKQDIQIDSVNSHVDISAAKEIKLICGGSYIKISEAGIELGTQDNIYLKCNAMQKKSPATETKTIQLKSSDLDVKRCSEMD